MFYKEESTMQVKVTGESPFIVIGKEIGELVTQKNLAYGDSYAKSERIMKELYPNGVKPEQYRDMMAVIRVIDKLFRIATRKNAFGESPWKDISGYGVLGVFNDQSKINFKKSRKCGIIKERGE